MKKILSILAGLMLLVGTTSAQIQSNTVPVTINSTISTSLTVSTDVNTLTLPGDGTDSPLLHVTTSWVQSPPFSLSVYAGFPSNALAGPAGYIQDVSGLKAKVNGGAATSFTAIAANAVSPMSVVLSSASVPGPSTHGTRADTVSLALTAAAVNSMPPGSYTGTLTIVAFIP